MRRFALVVLGIMGLCLTSPVSGLPLLQLDIAGGTYDPVTETVVASANPFALYALFDTTKGTPSGTYYIAAAIVPKTQEPPATSFGSFKVDGITYSAANMSYGNPPISIVESSKDLPSHGIYDTHYYEIAFTFDTTKRAVAYNTQENPGGFDADPSGTLVFEDFDVDVAGLAAGYQVHFDLYNLGIDKMGNLIVNNFAPFSHDAQGFSVADTSSTMILLGMAMLALEGIRRRFVS